MSRLPSFALLLPLCLVAGPWACGSADPGGGGADSGSIDGGSSDGGSSDGGGSDGGAVVPLDDVPTGGCGLDPYDWVPLDGMGQIVSVEAADDISFSAAAIDSILSSNGLGALTPVSHGVVGFRIRYTTQDRGQPVEATAYLMFPDVAEPADLPLLLWEHPTTGFVDQCAPTAQGIIGGAYGVLMAAHGFVVAAPDYLGMAGFGAPSDQLHPWVVAEPTAVASLDAAKAAITFAADQGESRGINARPDPTRTVVWGASEGAFAALWSDRYQAAYAPQLDLVGIVASMPPTDPAALATIGVTTWSPTTTAISAALVTMADWFRADQPLSTVIQPPFDGDLPERLEQDCEGWDDVYQRIDDPAEIFTADFVDAAASQDWSALQPWGCYLQAGTLRDSTIPRGSQAPVLIVTGEEDSLAWAEPVRSDVVALCEQDYEIEHVECAGAEHTEAGVQSLPYQLDWAKRAAAGTLDQPACVVSPPVDCTAL